MANPTWEETEPIFEETTDVESESPASEVDSLAYAAEPREYSMRESAGLSFSGTPTGVPQGLTLGFGDEIGAISGALGAKTGGDDRDFWEIYRNIRGVLREEGQSAADQNPWSALGGELIGGLAVPLGVAGNAAKTVSTASKIKRGRDVVKAGDSAVKQARIARELGKIGEMGKLGAKAGAISGLGNTDADLTVGEPGQFRQAIEDVAGSTVLGAGMGAGLQTLGKGVQLTGKGIAALPYVDDAIRIRELVKKGHSLAGQAKNISQEARDQAYNILGKLESLRTFTGTLVGKSREEADKLVGKIKIQDVVTNLRKQIEALKPIGRAEKEDIENVKQVLSDILEETEKVQHKYLPKPQLPKTSNVEKSAQKVAKKTAEAEAKDQIKLDELYSALDRVTDPDEEANIIAKIRKLEGDTQYPPEVINEELTQLPVLGVARGEKKAPIVEAITPEIEPVFTPIQRVEVGRSVVPNKTELTPGELSAHMQSVRDVPVETSKGQRALGMVQEELRGASKARAAEVGKPAQDAANILEEANKGFGGIKDIQKSLGLPESGKVLNPGQEKNIVDGIQRAILGLSENKISSDRFMEMTKELAEQFPQAANEIKDVAKSISERFQLSKMMSSQSLEGVKRGGLAIPAMMGRATEMATHTEQTVKKGATMLAKGTSSELASLGKQVHDASPEVIQKLAQRAAQKGGKFGTNTAKVLDSIVNAPNAKRKAILFTLMQQPDFREFAREAGAELFDLLPGGEE